MAEINQPKRGGRAYHSILESHFDFIRELRQRRKTWKEIAEMLLTEKGIRVTLYAPYRFYQRQLKRRAKGHWEDETKPVEVPPAHPNPAARWPQTRPAPLPQSADFKQPDFSKINTDIFQ